MECPISTILSSPCAWRHASSDRTKNCSASSRLRARNGGRPAGGGGCARGGEARSAPLGCRLPTERVAGQAGQAARCPQRAGSRPQPPT